MKAAVRMTTAGRLRGRWMSSTTKCASGPRRRSLGRAAQLQRPLVLARFGLGFRLHRLDPAALDTRRLDACGDLGVRCADRTGLLRRTQQSRTRNGARHQHLIAALMVEVAIGEAHARHRAAEAAVVGLLKIETGLERNALDRGANVLAADLERVAGQTEMTDRACAR